MCRLSCLCSQGIKEKISSRPCFIQSILDTYLMNHPLERAVPLYWLERGLDRQLRLDDQFLHVYCELRWMPPFVPIPGWVAHEEQDISAKIPSPSHFQWQSIQYFCPPSVIYVSCCRHLAGKAVICLLARKFWAGKSQNSWSRKIHSHFWCESI